MSVFAAYCFVRHSGGGADVCLYMLFGCYKIIFGICKCLQVVEIQVVLTIEFFCILLRHSQPFC